LFMKRNGITSNIGPDLFASAMFWLERQNHEAALEALLECYQLDYRKAEAEKTILEKCYMPYHEQQKSCYMQNVAALRSYPNIYGHDYPEFDKLRYHFIPYTAAELVLYDREKGHFSSFDLQIQLDSSQCEINKVYMIKDEFRLSSIMSCESKSRDPQPYLWAKIPLLLYYTNFNDFVQFLQIADFRPLLSSERVVFLFGQQELKQYYAEPQALYPEMLLNIKDGESDELVQFIMQQCKHLQEEISELQDRINSYYSSISRRDILKSIQAGKPRILFYTSRFTTALQYYIRDCALACDVLDIPNQVLMEKSDLHRVTLPAWLRMLNDFKPHIIFSIDHFRWGMPYLPDNNVFITWVQDILPHIASQESARKIGELDFILNAFVSNPDFLLDYGYPQAAMIDGPVVANPHIYQTYTLTEEELQRYGTNICAFSNTGNPQKGLEYFLEQIRSSPAYTQLEPVFKKAYREMYEAFYREEIIYTLDDYRDFLSDYLEAYGVSFSAGNNDELVQIWRQEIGYRILRSVPLEWLHEKGYDLKLWGKEWLEHPILADCAQGVAPNGENLSRIINACKIVIGTNPGISTHPRVFESLLSGSFYLAYRIPAENDWADIRQYLQEDQEIIFAYSREDLYKKVDYYLAHAEERRQVIEQASKKIKAGLTYEALLERVFQEIVSQLEARIEKSSAMKWSVMPE